MFHCSYLIRLIGLALWLSCSSHLSYATSISLKANRCQMVFTDFVREIRNNFGEGSYEKKTFLYSTPWSFDESMSLLARLPEVTDPKVLDRRTAYTLSAAVVHSWENAEKIFSPQLIDWALSNYSSLDMPWVHLREKIKPSQPPPQVRLFIHNPQVEKAYRIESHRANFAETYRNYSVSKEKLNEVLRKNWAPNTEISEARIAGFDVETHVLERDGALFEEGWVLKWRFVEFAYKKFQKRYNIGFDSPFGMVLKYEEEPLAVTSFDVLGDALFLNHIQGVRGKLFMVAPDGTLDYARDANGVIHRAPPNSAVGKIKLRPLLVDLIRQAARDLGFKKVIIQKGANNKWIRPHGSEVPDMNLERAEETYDKTAQQLGAVKDDQGNWVLWVDP